jgi:hypothetical protein
LRRLPDSNWLFPTSPAPVRDAPDGVGRLPNRQSFSRRGCFGATMAELSTEICESRQVRSRTWQPQGSDAQLPFAHGSNVCTSRCSTRGKDCCTETRSTKRARGSDCHWRGGGSRLRMFTTDKGRALLGVATFSAPQCNTFHGSCSRCCPTWFLVRSTSTHTRYTASYTMHGAGLRSVTAETGLIPSDCNRRV